MGGGWEEEEVCSGACCCPGDKWCMAALWRVARGPVWLLLSPAPVPNKPLLEALDSVPNMPWYIVSSACEPELNVEDGA
jgi:hypothetical protein